MAKWLDVTLTKRTDWNPHLFSLTFDCPEFGAFKAGQFIKVGLEQADGKVLSRPYSLVNGPDSHELEILAVPVEDGQLSNQLHQLKKGDKAKIMAPATGFLILDEVPQSEQLWMMATGTGVGPFLSILTTDRVWQRYDKVVLVYGVRQIADLAYPELIERFKEQYPQQFQFVPIVSREEYSDGLSGRIPARLVDNSIQDHCGLSLAATNSQVMLCGNPDMIEETMVVLENMGLRKNLRREPGQVTLERYW